MWLVFQLQYIRSLSEIHLITILAIFGESLAETMKFERGRSNRKVPYIVEACIDFLRQYGTEIEGIFR